VLSPLAASSRARKLASSPAPARLDFFFAISQSRLTIVVNCA
jgi:hypothetical protein